MARTVRLAVPLALVAAGLILLVAVGGDWTGAGVVLIGGAALVAGYGFLARLSLSSEDDRAREEAARREFERTGRWPRQSR